jgi:hypothetical protein
MQGVLMGSTVLNRIDIELDDQEYDLFLNKHITPLSEAEDPPILLEVETFGFNSKQHGHITLAYNAYLYDGVTLVFMFNSTPYANHELARALSKLYPDKAVTHQWFNGNRERHMRIGGNIAYQAGNVVSNQSIYGESSLTLFLAMFFSPPLRNCVS